MSVCVCACLTSPPFTPNPTRSSTGDLVGSPSNHGKQWPVAMVTSQSLGSRFWSRGPTQLTGSGFSRRPHLIRFVFNIYSTMCVVIVCVLCVVCVCVLCVCVCVCV